MKRLIYFSFFIFSFSFSQAQIISTYAGNGIGGYTGNGGQATAAEINAPEGVALDDSGNIYIADLSDGRVHKVIASTGIITEIAGNGITGYSGDGGQATEAELYYPNNLVIDDSGNIYISDGKNNAIRKITASTGIIYTVAGVGGNINFGYSGDGGAATEALLDLPWGVALDDSDNIYIADYKNNVIRKVTASTGIITTVVGNGYGYYRGAGTWTGALAGDGGPATAAELYGPFSIVLDDSDNMFIADDYNNVIRKVTKSTGIITTVAGNGLAGYTGIIGNGGPATAAELWYTNYVCVDDSDNIYITDAHDVVRKVTASTGIITTFAGNDSVGYSGDGGPATDAEFITPAGVAVDKFDNLYIADVSNARVRKVTYDTNTVTRATQLTINNGKCTIFPNPNDGVFNLYLSNVSVQSKVEVFNYLGENIYQSKINFGNTEINLSEQPNGIYLYKVLKDNGELVGEGKVVIER
jgi:trimeric autotransporter adhesin